MARKQQLLPKQHRQGILWAHWWQTQSYQSLASSLTAAPLFCAMLSLLTWLADSFDVHFIGDVGSSRGTSGRRWRFEPLCSLSPAPTKLRWELSYVPKDVFSAGEGKGAEGEDGVWGLTTRGASAGCALLWELSQLFPFPGWVPSTYALLLHLSNMARIDFPPCSLLTAQSETPKTLKSRSGFYSLSKQAVEKGKEGASTYTKRLKAIEQIYSF